MLRRILLLLGETPSSIAARQYALNLARGTEAVVAGLTGIDLPFVEAGMPGRIGAGAYAAQLRHTLKKQADEIGRRLSELLAAESRAERVASELVSFEGDPVHGEFVNPNKNGAAWAVLWDVDSCYRRC